MKFTGFVLAALAAIAQAIQFDFDAAGFAPVAGVPITLKWSDAAGPVTITLMNGPIGNLKDVQTITSGQSSGSFTWTPPKDIPTDVYALKITDGASTNYSPQFNYVGNGVATPTLSATTSGVASTNLSSSTITSTTISNSNMTTMTTTKSATSTKHFSTTSSTPAATTSPVNQNSSQRLASSLALVIGALAAFVVFN